MSNPFRQLPAVDKLLEAPEIKQAAGDLSRPEIAAVIRRELEEIRRELAQGQRGLNPEEITARVTRQLKRRNLSRFQPVINATGVMIHTNVGRAPLPEHALQRLQDLGRGYLNLELDLASGSRGSRYAGVSQLFSALLGDEGERNDTVVVNNNAGAVLLVLKALTAGSEVIVSRGQLVEIGGGFRVPEVMAASGCQLVEVGTTNRTRLSDYAQAITAQTKAILLVHPSNYTIVGFTEAVPREQLAQLAEEHGLYLIEDLGSGSFTPFPEPRVSTALAHSHIVTYSGDKLLGGPQAGIISGRRELMAQIKKDPLLRALRIDKLSLIALEAVLELYLKKEYASLPLWALANLPAEKVKARAEKWLHALGPGLQGEVVASSATMGGGSLPGEELPSWALALASPNLSAQELLAHLRSSRPPILARIVQDRVLLDPRTVLPEQDQEVAALLQKGVRPCS